ncbi:MAG: DUF4347 domain-containing protein, partial [Gammaproteobacteria bacterium]|nr:DUF4347 domain-containing protein [Gammaproteobacteria bacterium]
MFDGAGLVDAVNPEVVEPLVIESPAAVPEVAEAQPKSNEIVFVDTVVADYQELLKGIDPDTEVIFLDGNRDGLQQMVEALSGRTDIDALHIVSHGQAGMLKLGSSLIDQVALEGYADELASIGATLSQDGDILLYGCNIAEGSAGEGLIQQLASMTKADIAASTDATGSSELEGDWELEANTGEIEADAALEIAAMEAYDHTLGTVTDSFDGLGDVTISSGSTHGDFIYTHDGSIEAYSTSGGFLYVGQGGVTQSITLTRSGGAAFQAISLVEDNIGGNTAFSVSGWLSGSQVTSTLNFTSAATVNHAILSADSQFQNIDELRITGLDLLFYWESFTYDLTAAASNAAPTVTGTPSDPSLTEDTKGNIDLSALTFGDVDGDNLTVTLTASEGTFDTPLDGSGVGSGVTETWVDATHVTLAGSAADINTYLDTAANIKYTGATDDNGDNTATITVSADDGNGGNLAANPVVNIDITAAADTPSVASPTISEDADSGAIAITRAAGDGTETTHYQITSITNGTLYSDAGFTAQINNSDFVASAGATTNVYFRPTANFNGSGGFTVQASSADNVGGLAGSTAASTITVDSVADTPAVASPTINEDTDSSAIAITRAAVDGAETTHYQITGITNGTLYSDAGFSTQINNSDFIASAGGTTNVYFRPTANFNGPGGFTVQASSANNVGGLAGSTAASTVTVDPIADTPTAGSVTVNEDTDTGAITITRHASDGASTTHFKVTSITNGTLFSDAGFTVQVNNSDFIAFGGGGSTDLYFRPSAESNSTTGGNGSFTVQASLANNDGGLAGSTATSTITLDPVADTPSVASPTINEDADSGAIAITRAAADGAETTHYQITSITNGTLYSDAGFTVQINNSDFIASAGATTNVYFRPTANFNGSGGFTVQASSANNVGGLAGSTVGSTITVDPINDLAALNLDANDSSGAGGNNFAATFLAGGSAVNIADTDTAL